MITKFKNFFKQFKSDFDEAKKNIEEKEENFFLVNLYKHLDEKIDDAYNRVSVKFNKDRDVEIDLYKDGNLSETIYLQIVKTPKWLSTISPLSLMCNKIFAVDLETKKIIYDFLVENGYMEEEEVEPEGYD